MAVGNIYIRDMKDRSIVRTIKFEGGERKLDRVERGLIRQTDTDRFIVDTSEVDDALEAEAEAT